jgi:DNA-binding NarL/FixJ family response regulator
VLRIAVVDDSPDIRALFCAELAAGADFEVCADAADGAGAVEIAGRLRPDVMLLDLSMPGMSGLDALPLILAASPSTAVIVLSGFGRRGYAESACALGARGFLEKSLPVGGLCRRLLEVLEAPAEPAGRDTAEPAFGPW